MKNVLNVITRKIQLKIAGKHHYTPLEQLKQPWPAVLALAKTRDNWNSPVVGFSQKKIWAIEFEVNKC